MVCPALWTEEGRFLMGSGQAGPFCPMLPPPSPLLTESATRLTLYLLSSTHFPKRKSEVLWSLNLKSVRKCLFVGFGFLPCPKVKHWLCPPWLTGLFGGPGPSRHLWGPAAWLPFGSPFFIWNLGLLSMFCMYLFSVVKVSFTSHCSGASGHLIAAFL